MATSDDIFGAPYPIVKHPKGFFHKQSGLEVYKSDILILLLTNPGERVMMPEYGTPLRKYLFEPNSESTVDAVKDAISKSISRWEPRITVNALEVGADMTDSLNPNDDKTEVDHILGVKIDFIDPNNISQIGTVYLELPGG